MSAVERLSWEDVAASTVSASEHTHRYRWAARMVRGLRVLDLCCGIGYGSALLAAEAGSVTGIDLSEEAIAATSEVQGTADIEFAVGDAMEVLARPDLAGRFDAIVCFEGLEHLPDLARAIELLAGHAEQGVRILASLPNSRTFHEDNEFHVTQPDLEVALEAFGRLPDAHVSLQYVAEGSLIVGAAADEPEPCRIDLLDRAEPEYANNFLVAVNVPEELHAEALDGLARLTLSPYFNRELATLKRANTELWRVNQRLGRQLRELTANGDLREPAWQALRQGQTSAGRTLAKLAAEAERGQDTDEELLAARSEAAVGWGRYHELRNRRVVRLALRLSRLGRGGGG